MGFSDSAEDMRFEDGCMLRARLRNANGDWVDAEINLDDCIGNVDGRFEWGGSGFSGSADRTWLSMEGNNYPILRAALTNGNGDVIENVDINLDERISNYDGNFHFE